MSAYGYIPCMKLMTSPAQIGSLIRARRRALGWDQATLASHAGVSRQWVIDVEKGKPRAELQLVLSTLAALGISLSAETGDVPVTSGRASERPVDPEQVRLPADSFNRAYDAKRSREPKRSVAPQSGNAAKAASAALKWLDQQKMIDDALTSYPERKVGDIAASIAALGYDSADKAAGTLVSSLDQATVDQSLAGFAKHRVDAAAAAMASMAGLQPDSAAKAASAALKWLDQQKMIDDALTSYPERKVGDIAASISALGYDSADKAAGALVSSLDQATLEQPLAGFAKRRVDAAAAAMAGIHSDNFAKAISGAAMWLDEQQTTDGVMTGSHLQDSSSTVLRKGDQMASVSPLDRTRKLDGVDPDETARIKKKKTYKRRGTDQT